MTYELSTTIEGLPLIIVNENIFFSWDTANPFYDLFIERVNTVGMEHFAELLAADPNTAFYKFCNGE